MGKISDMDWAQHFKMNYAQNLRKDPVNRCKGQKKDHTHGACHCQLIDSNGGIFFACFSNAQKTDSQIFCQWRAIFCCGGTENR